MRNWTLLIMAIVILMFSACGSSGKNKKDKSMQDSIAKVDSIAKLVVEVDSWDFYKAGKDDTTAFKANYGNRKLIIKNLVVENVWSDKKTVQCIAYLPQDKLLSSPSKEGDKKNKLDASVDIVQGITCKYNTDLYSPYYIELHFKSPVDENAVKERIVVDEPGSKIWNYFTILTVEGDSAVAVSNNFILKNCIIKENITK